MKARSPRTLLEAVTYFADTDRAHAHFVSVRWPNGVACPRHCCGSAAVQVLAKRRKFRCKECGRDFTAKVGTIFEASPISLSKWLPAVWLLAGKSRARAMVVPNHKASSLIPRIHENVTPGSRLYTDALRSYRQTDRDFIHDFIDHSLRYVEGRVHTNTIENFWSCVKRTLHGTYIAVRPFHLNAYIDEQVFRLQRARGERRGSVSLHPARCGRQARDVRRAYDLAPSVAATPRSRRSRVRAPRVARARADQRKE